MHANGNHAAAFFGAYHMRKSSKPAATKAATVSAPAVAPATPDAKAAAIAAAAVIAAAARDIARAGYNGPSLSVRNGNPKLAALIARAQTPVQIAGSLTVRDLSGLAAIKANADAAGAFDPLAIKLDAGVCSRLASRGLIAANADASGLTLTERGLNTKA
jgi:hypothetical protein